MVTNCKTHHICVPFCIFRKLYHKIFWRWIFLRLFSSLFCKFHVLEKIWLLSYGSKSHWSIKLHYFSECSVLLTTWLFGMIIIDNPRVMEEFPVVLEVEKDTLLLEIVYRIPDALGTFIDDLFYWSMNCHSTIFWLMVILSLIRCCLRMLLKLILQFKIITCLSVHNIQLIHEWLLDLAFDTSNSKLFRIYHHPAVTTLFFNFFSKSDNYIYIEFSFQQFFFQSSCRHLSILVLISCFLNLMKGLVRIFGRNNQQSKVIISFLFLNIILVKKQI